MYCSLLLMSSSLIMSLLRGARVAAYLHVYIYLYTALSLYILVYVTSNSALFNNLTQVMFVYCR